MRYYTNNPDDDTDTQRIKEELDRAEDAIRESLGMRRTVIEDDAG